VGVAYSRKYSSSKAKHDDYGKSVLTSRDVLNANNLILTRFQLTDNIAKAFHINYIKCTWWKMCMELLGACCLKSNQEFLMVGHY
jgi:hypothetical protein